MKINRANTLAAIIFFLFMGLASLPAMGSTSKEDQKVDPLPKAAENTEKMVSQQNLPVVTLPEVICTAKKSPPLPKILFGKEMKAWMASIEMPKIRMVDFSTIINGIIGCAKEIH